MNSFHPRLLSLDLKKLCFYDFAMLLNERYNLSVFEPIKAHIPPEDFHLFFEEVFPETNNFAHLITIEFLDYVRMEVLKNEGMPTIDGYYHNKNNIVDVEYALYKYYSK